VARFFYSPDGLPVTLTTVWKLKQTDTQTRGMAVWRSGNIQAMLVWLTLPFYDFCGFRSVAVNSVFINCSFFTFI